MAKRCTEGGNIHGTVRKDREETTTVGDEEVVYAVMVCNDCDQVTSMPIVSRRKK